jgi:CBS domain-containing protein
MAAGVVCAPTPERLRAASDGGIISAVDADTLIQSFELVSELRLHHQVEQLIAGVKSDDFVDPSELSPLYSQLPERSVSRCRHRATGHP